MKCGQKFVGNDRVKSPLADPQTEEGVFNFPFLFLNAFLEDVLNGVRERETILPEEPFPCPFYVCMFVDFS